MSKWFTQGFGPDLENFSTSKQFYLDLRTSIEVPKLRPMDYAVSAAHHIIDSYPRPINVLLSGGIDSQAMVDAFLQTRRMDEFRIVTFRFNDDLNIYDIEWADRLRSQLGFKHEIIDFDVIKFHEYDLVEWSRKYVNHSPHALSHAKMVSLLEGTSVLAGNPAIVSNDNRISGLPNFSLMGADRYAAIEGKKIVSMFFAHTPELFYSFFRWRTGHLYQEKCSTFRSAGFRFELPPMKYHGFEALKERYDATSGIDPRISRHYALKYKSNRTYDHLFRHPLMEEIPYSENVVGVPENRMFEIGR